MQITLKIRYDERAPRTAAAWWLPGADAAAWLDEAARLPGRGDGRWIVVAGDRHGTVRGAIYAPASSPSVSPASEFSAGATSRPPTIVPLARIDERFYVPVASCFEPAIADAEAASLVPRDGSIYAWLPVDGLVRCDESAVRDAHAFVAPPRRDDARWDAARPGVASSPRLVSIVSSATLDVGEIWQQARGDIGTRAERWTELPPRPDEPSTLRVLAGRWGPRLLLVAGLAVALFVVARSWSNSGGGGGIAWLLGLLPIFIGLLMAMRGFRDGSAPAPHKTAGAAPAASGGAANGRGWFAGVRRWWQDRREAIDRRLEEIRNREVRRLLDLLTRSPDEGLRFALPVGGGDGDWRRGRAASSSRLLERLVDFSLGRLGGGGPADVWAIDAQYQAQLVARYRELAVREIGLGRHRRAAYIFAELLGDLPSAARTLADGGHYREAATLYRDRLNDVRAAANCLEKGGLLNEAIGLYERLGELEHAGELCERLDLRDEAVAYYRRAVAARVAACDLVQAARLLERRLGAPEEALAMLDRGWPDSFQATTCFAETFAILGRLEAHERAAREVTRRSAEPHSTSNDVPLAAALAGVAETYPDAAVRDLAADRARVIVGRRLERSVSDETENLLAALRRLAPRDRLLARDCDRYRQSRRANPLPRPVPKRLELERQWRLPPGIWTNFIAAGDLWYAAGRGPADAHDVECISLMRGDWEGVQQAATGPAWRIGGDASEFSIILHAFGPTLGVQQWGCEPFSTYRLFPATDRWPQIQAGAMPAFTPLTVAACESASIPGDLVSLLRWSPPDDALVVESYWRYGTTMAGTEALNFELFRSSLPDLRFVVARKRDARDGWYLGGRFGLYRWTRQPKRHASVTCLLHEPVEQLVRSLGPIRVAAGLERGARAWLGEPPDAPEFALGDDLESPRVGLLASGVVMLAARGVIEVHGVVDGRLAMYARVQGLDERPTAVLHLRRSDRVAVAYPSGVVCTYVVRPPAG